jgi:hypothetical protein
VPARSRVGFGGTGLGLEQGTRNSPMAAWATRPALLLVALLLVGYWLLTRDTGRLLLVVCCLCSHCSQYHAAMSVLKAWCVLFSTEQSWCLLCCSSSSGKIAGGPQVGAANIANGKLSEICRCHIFLLFKPCQTVPF